MKEVTISIVAIGDLGSGKTLAIHYMTKALNDKFEIIAQQPAILHIQGVETYTFRARLKEESD